jgi:chromatin remodeling complex protein RSC6
MGRRLDASDRRGALKGELMAKTAKKKTARKANAAFMKPMTPSESLSEVVGDKPLPRTEVTKKLWAYIKKNGLQDAKNRRNINADDKLKPVFGGKKTVSMFEMTKLVNKHLK